MSLLREMFAPIPKNIPAPKKATVLDNYDPELIDDYAPDKTNIRQGHHIVPLVQNEYYFRLLLEESRKQTVLLERIAARLDEKAGD